MTGPEEAARRIVRELKRLGSPARAAGASAYFKAYEKLSFFGVDSPTIRRLAARVRKVEAADWTLDEAVRFADALIARPQLEAKGLGICLLGRFRRSFDRRLLGRSKRWLARGCTDWASTDALCGEVLGPLLVARPELIRSLRPWRRSPALYVRRASAVALIVPARRGGAALDEAYGTALALAGEEHHLLHKAAGWLLREAGKSDPARLERFLRRHGGRLSRTTVRYAIERFPARTRRELLAATRAQARG